MHQIMSIFMHLCEGQGAVLDHPEVILMLNKGQEQHIG